jgi:hypothetical protein
MRLVDVFLAAPGATDRGVTRGQRTERSGLRAVSVEVRTLITLLVIDRVRRSGDGSSCL